MAHEVHSQSTVGIFIERCLYAGWPSLANISLMWALAGRATKNDERGSLGVDVADLVLLSGAYRSCDRRDNSKLFDIATVILFAGRRPVALFQERES
jgi:hypothetical protein